MRDASPAYHEASINPLGVLILLAGRDVDTILFNRSFVFITHILFSYMRGKMEFVSFHTISRSQNECNAETRAYDKGHFITKSGTLFFHGYGYKMYDNRAAGARYFKFPRISRLIDYTYLRINDINSIAREIK